MHFLILHHLRASQYERGWTDSAVRRFAREMDDGLTDLLDLSRADITTKRPEQNASAACARSASCRIASRSCAAEDARVPPLPKGLGDAIMAHFGLPPSRRIGEIKRASKREVEAGALQPHQDSAYYVAWIVAHREELGL